MPATPQPQDLETGMSAAAPPKPHTEFPEERPLVTFSLIAYNQEQYIREAIEGALSQTYSPLEITLSDDCSPDGTFAIMEELAASYEGPHKVILNRNEKNLGLARHVNVVMDMAQGEWIVFAAGDDVSLSSRVSTTMGLASKHPTAYSIMLGVNVIGSCRKKPKVINRITKFPETLQRCNGVSLGASHACRRASYIEFGPLPHNVWEDCALGFRASLLGCVVSSTVIGVNYRIHEKSITSQQILVSMQLPQICQEIAIALCMKRDLELAIEKGWVKPSAGQKGLNELHGLLKTNKLLKEITKCTISWRKCLLIIRLMFSVDPCRNVFWKIDVLRHLKVVES